MLLSLSLRGGQYQPIVQVSQQADSPGVSPRRDRRENPREHLWGGREAETRCLELVDLAIQNESKQLPGSGVYWDLEVGVLEVYGG